jgi:hypothetical protein
LWLVELVVKERDLDHRHIVEVVEEVQVDCELLQHIRLLQEHLSQLLSEQVAQVQQVVIVGEDLEVILFLEPLPL